MPWNFDYFVPFTTTNLETNWAVKHKILNQFPELTKMLEDKYNQKFIAMQGFDDYGIGTVKQWQKASELKGVKVIAAGPNLPWVSLFGSIPCDKIGRKNTLIWIGILFFVSALGSAIAWDPYSFSFFRFIGGVGVGASTVASPTYISEISNKESRGRLRD